MQTARNKIAQQRNHEAGIIAGPVIAAKADDLLREPLHAALHHGHGIGVEAANRISLHGFTAVPVRKWSDGNVGAGCGALHRRHQPFRRACGLGDKPADDLGQGGRFHVLAVRGFEAPAHIGQIVAQTKNFALLARHGRRAFGLWFCGGRLAPRRDNPVRRKAVKLMGAAQAEAGGVGGNAERGGRLHCRRPAGSALRRRPEGPGRNRRLHRAHGRFSILAGKRLVHLDLGHATSHAEGNQHRDDPENQDEGAGRWPALMLGRRGEEVRHHQPSPSGAHRQGWRP